MRWLCVIFLVALSGCTSWREVPDDLTFKGLHEGTELYGKSPRWEFIDIELATNVNYENYVNDNWGYVGVVAYFCEKDDYKVQMLGGFGLYRKDEKWISLGAGVKDNSNPPYYYHTGLNTHNHDKESMAPQHPTVLDYDLREKPLDICLYLNAGTTLSHQKSNIVRIPKEELIKFFAEHPRPEAGSSP